MKHENHTGNVIFLTGITGTAGLPVVNEVEAYWEALRKDQALPPARSDVDPRGLKRVLSNAFIVERIAPGVAQFRVAGRFLSQMTGLTMPGLPLSMIFVPDSREEMARHTEAMFSRPQALRLNLVAERPFGRALQAEMLLLPLRDETQRVTRALGCLATRGTPGRRARRFRICGLQARSLGGSRPALVRQPTPVVPESGSANKKGPDGARPTLRLVSTSD